MYTELVFDFLMILLAIRISMLLDLNYWKLVWSWKSGLEFMRKSCSVISFASACTPSSDLSLATSPDSSTAIGVYHSISPSLKSDRIDMSMPQIQTGDRFSFLQALRPEQLATALAELDPHVLEPHMDDLSDLLLSSSKQLSLTDLSQLFLAVAELFTKEGKPTTRQLLRNKDSTSLWLLSVMKDMSEQAILLIDSSCSPNVAANLAHACALFLPRHIRVGILYTSFRKLLLELIKYMGTEQGNHTRTHTAQDLRKIFLAFTQIKLLNKSYTKKMKQRLICLAEELKDGELVQEFINSV